MVPFLAAPAKSSVTAQGTLPAGWYGGLGGVVPFQTSAPLAPQDLGSRGNGRVHQSLELTGLNVLQENHGTPILAIVCHQTQPLQEQGADMASIEAPDGQLSIPDADTRLVGQDTQMPDLLILLATLGGISLFGLLGFIVGPIVAALFGTIWEIYGVVFRDLLPAGRGAPRDAGPVQEE